jgi:hypothetical protein
MIRPFVLIAVSLAMLLYSILFIVGEVLARILDLIDAIRCWLRKQIGSARSQM